MIAGFTDTGKSAQYNTNSTGLAGWALGVAGATKQAAHAPGAVRALQSEGTNPCTGKVGDDYMRRLLVQCAHYILGPFGPDTDLRRFGLRIVQRAGVTPGRGHKKRTSPKKKAVVAVARKLAVLLHRLWLTGEVYQPLGYGSARGQGAAA